MNKSKNSNSKKKIILKPFYLTFSKNNSIIDMYYFKKGEKIC